MKTVLVSLMAAATLPLFAQKDASIRIYPEQGNQQISKHIYGQFAEHLGTCIYGGLWVGPESEIPNTQGYRNDVLNALKELKIPNLRWPGGCFADEYHWMDGIGPKENRPKMVNNNWGGTIEDNSFGTHEFLNLCELLGCEPYISANVGSGTVEEMAKWVEYMTSEGDSPMARLCACPDTVTLCQTVLTDLYNEILADYSSPLKLVKSRAFISALLPHLTFVNGANVPSIRYGIRKYVLGEG